MFAHVMFWLVAFLGYFLFWAIIFSGYFLPTIIACIRKHTNVWAIFVLNLFLGFTLIGWVIALVWAVHKKEYVPRKK